MPRKKKPTTDKNWIRRRLVRVVGFPANKCFVLRNSSPAIWQVPDVYKYLNICRKNYRKVKKKSRPFQTRPGRVRTVEVKKFFAHHYTRSATAENSGMNWKQLRWVVVRMFTQWLRTQRLTGLLGLKRFFIAQKQETGKSKISQVNLDTYSRSTHESV